jgi:hypothetical protein
LLILAAGWGPRDKAAVRAAQKKATLQLFANLYRLLSFGQMVALLDWIIYQSQSYQATVE